MNSAIIGLGFGDEGKGLTTSYLCSEKKDPIVVRFNGGHQAGHTVVYNGKRHVFSSFGSGTLQGVPTYWSKYCTFCPTGFMNEFIQLTSVTPKIYINPLCPVTTPYDIRHNNEEMWTKNGTVGVGFGATIQRQENYYKLFVQDLRYPSVVKQKLKAIAAYYGYQGMEEDVAKFMEAVEWCLEIISVRDQTVLWGRDLVFEGAQGILLDMDFGFFPNVTRSNTTTKNIYNISNLQEVYYVTRAYLTRHGNGYFPPERELNLKNAENETNTNDGIQGVFRKTDLDVDLINYALMCDGNFSTTVSKNLVITCMDQYNLNVPALLSQINTRFDRVLLSYGHSLTDIKDFRDVQYDSKDYTIYNSVRVSPNITYPQELQ